MSVDRMFGNVCFNALSDKGKGVDTYTTEEQNEQYSRPTHEIARIG